MADPNNSNSNPNPNHYVTFGPDTNCTLAVCPVSFSVYQYRPSLPANSIFIALFGLALIIHVAQGMIWRTWVFTFAMFWGCVAELIGYGGRIMLWKNPFSFTGFLTQITVGGALSTETSGDSQPAIDTSIAGLSFQVFTLCVFIALALEYAWRYTRAKDARIDKSQLPRNFKIFVTFLSLAIILILVRCIYRIDELSEGYTGPLIRNEGLFIALEGVMVLAAAFCLNIAQPGPVFGWPSNTGHGSADISAPRAPKNEQNA
ncbi:MAG: hypothetical protein Q9163_005623 [Psora crenata]